ncbi:MAG: hypothetical protein ACI4OA_00560 [Selenomonadaceae bacterium]
MRKRKEYLEAFGNGFTKGFMDCFDKIIATVREKALADNVKALMETLPCKKEKAMELLKVPADIQPKVLALL